MPPSNNQPMSFTMNSSGLWNSIVLLWLAFHDAQGVWTPYQSGPPVYKNRPIVTSRKANWQLCSIHAAWRKDSKTGSARYSPMTSHDRKDKQVTRAGQCKYRQLASACACKKAYVHCNKAGPCLFTGSKKSLWIQADRSSQQTNHIM